MEEVGARVSLKNARKAQRDAKGVSDSITGIGKSSQRASRRMASIGTAGRSLGAGLHTVGVGAAYAAAGGVALGAAFGVRTYRAFDQSRKIAAQTNAVIKSTGGAAKVTADDVANLSQRIAERTGVDDEAIQSGSNLLLTFKKVRNEQGKGNKVFDRATQAAVDLSAAGFGSIQSASKMLGKALNDPVKGMTAMGRAGVTFTKGQKDQIAAMVKAGDTLGAQKLIMREVESQVGGSAAAQGTSLDKLKVSWGNIEEAIGSGVAPAVDAISADMTKLARSVLPSVENAAARVGDIFGRSDLDWVSKLRLSGRAVSQEMGPEVRPIVASIQQELGKIDAGKALGDAIQKGAPVMADAMAAQVPHMASAFINAFRNAGPGGQLLTVALLAAKFGAFRPMGAAAAGMFTSSFRTSAAASSVWSSTGATAGRSMGSGLVVHGADTLGQSASQGKFATAGQMIGTALGVVAAAYLAKTIGDGLRDRLDKASQAGGIEGFLGSLGGAVDDITRGGGDIAKFGPLAAPIAAVEDSKKRLDSIGNNKSDGKTPTPASPSTKTGRLAPTGPAALPSRGANFRLPDSGSKGGKDLHVSLEIGGKVFDRAVVNTVTGELKRQAARK